MGIAERPNLLARRGAPLRYWQKAGEQTWLHAMLAPVMIALGNCMQVVLSREIARGKLRFLKVSRVLRRNPLDRAGASQHQSQPILSRYPDPADIGSVASDPSRRVLRREFCFMQGNAYNVPL